MRVLVASRSTLGHQAGGMESFVEHQLLFLESTGAEVLLVTAPGLSREYRTALDVRGIEVAELPGSVHWKYTKAWHSTVELEITKWMPDLCIFHGLAGLGHRANPSTSAVTVTHGSVALSLYNATLGERKLRSFCGRLWTFLRWAEPLRLRSHRLVALSSYDRTLSSLSYLTPRSKIALIHPAIISGGGRAVRERRVVFVGRLEPLKGIEHLVRAWLDLGAEGWVLSVVGAGSQLELIRDMVGSSPSVEILGRLDQSEVRRILGSSRWMVTSGRVRESFGLSAAEALACGTPVIYSKRGALPSTVLNAGVGYRRSDDLVGALRRAISMDEPEWEKLSIAAIARSRAFSEEEYEKRWMRVLFGRGATH